jgi:hypothetical protein
MKTGIRFAVAASFAGALHGPLLAAGGHFAVDDAGILDQGACKVEGRFEHSGAPARLVHGSAGCRVGPVELVAASEYQRQGGGAGSQTDHALQVKWAREFGAGLSAGLSLEPQWQARAQPRYQGITGRMLLSWQPRETVSLHANLGRDFVRSGPDEARHGVNVNWALHDKWKLIAERYRQEGGQFARAGVRWEPADGWSVDFSRAVRLRGAGDSSWTIGLTREFDR